MLIGELCGDVGADLFFNLLENALNNDLIGFCGLEPSLKEFDLANDDDAVDAVANGGCGVWTGCEGVPTLGSELDLGRNAFDKMEVFCGAG